MEYEILEECYIPEYGDSDDEMETRSANDNFLNELEMVAIDNANLPTKYQITPETRAFGLGTKPSGYITMDNDFTRKSEPVKGVKVRCYFLVNISSAYTSSTGYYKIGHKYVCGPHYSIVYENTNDFTIWGNWAWITAAQHSLGYHSKSGHDKHINKEENEWKWAVINNAGYDYYEMCKKEGIKTPQSTRESSLKIWCGSNLSWSSAPMLRNLSFNLVSIGTCLAAVLLGAPGVCALGLAEGLINSVMPDIIIGMDYTANRNTRDEVKVTPNSHYEYHYGDVWHELSHASHFQYAGEAVWGPYIDKIVKNYIEDKYRLYGFSDDGSKGAGIIGLGESWAYAMQKDIMASKFKIDYEPFNDIWFDQYALNIYSLFTSSDGLSKKQIMKCMTKNVKSAKDLKNALLKSYPEKEKEINYYLKF